MGIDGIGGGKPPLGPSGGAAGPSKTSGEGFSIDRPSAAAGADATSKTEASHRLSATAELERLEAGEISLDDYLRARAAQAVAHLEAVVPAEQLEIIKEQLVHQMKQDPTVASLVQRATGVLPTDNEG